MSKEAVSFCQHAFMVDMIRLTSLHWCFLAMWPWPSYWVSTTLLQPLLSLCLPGIHRVFWEAHAWGYSWSCAPQAHCAVIWLFANGISISPALSATGVACLTSCYPCDSSGVFAPVKVPLRISHTPEMHARLPHSLSPEAAFHSCSPGQASCSWAVSVGMLPMPRVSSVPGQSHAPPMPSPPDTRLYTVP